MDPGGLAAVGLVGTRGCVRNRATAHGGSRGVVFGTFGTARLMRGPVPTVRTGSGEEATRAHATPAAPPLWPCGGQHASLPRVSAAGTIRRMDDRVALAVYFLIAAAAAFVTAARTLPVPLLLLVLLALAIAATLVRTRVLALGRATRATVGFIAVYLVTFFAMVVLLRP